jgi:hypothetical protein
VVLNVYANQMRVDEFLSHLKEMKKKNIRVRRTLLTKVARGYVNAEKWRELIRFLNRLEEAGIPADRTMINFFRNLKKSSQTYFNLKLSEPLPEAYRQLDISMARIKQVWPLIEDCLRRLTPKKRLQQ